jgi:hypothetical protein
VDFKSTLFRFIKKIGDENVEMPRKSRENYKRNRRELKKQLEEIERNPKRPAKSSTEMSRECRERQNSARQEAFHPSLTLEPQPSISTAQIEPEQQEQMEIDDIDPNFQTFTPSMEYQCTSPVFTTPLDNECITSQTFTSPMHSELGKNKSNNKKSTLGPRRISKYITRQLSFVEYFNDVERVR